MPSFFLIHRLVKGASLELRLQPRRRSQSRSFFTAAKSCIFKLYTGCFTYVGAPSALQKFWCHFRLNASCRESLCNSFGSTSISGAVLSNDYQGTGYSESFCICAGTILQLSYLKVRTLTMNALSRPAKRFWHLSFVRSQLS